MEIIWIYLIISILLLWIPAPFFYPESAKERMISNVYGFDFTLLNYMGCWQNWLDGIRAFAGAYCLINLAIFPDPDVEHADYLVMGTKAAILGIAIVLQTVHWHRIFFFHAPVVFIWGVTVVLSGWLLGVYAIVAAICASVMSNSLELKFWITAGVLAIFGYMLGHSLLPLALNVAVVIVPLALVYSFNNHLVALTISTEPEEEEEEADEGERDE